MAQVLKARVKVTAPQQVKDLCEGGAPFKSEVDVGLRLGGGPCDVVLKVVFDENEKKYED